MAAGKINLQKASGGVASITIADGASNTNLVLPESGTVATTASATESVQGLIELATTAEAQAGTDDLRAITPLKLKNSVLGLGQTWQDVTASRVLGTTYTNTTGKPILVQIGTSGTVANTSSVLTVDGVVRSSFGIANSILLGGTLSAIIPNNSTYSVTSNNPIIIWSELR